jgi:hypothetical protein
VNVVKIKSKNRGIKIITCVIVYFVCLIMVFVLSSLLIKISKLSCLELKDRLYLSMMILFMLVYIMIHYIDLILKNNIYS